MKVTGASFHGKYLTARTTAQLISTLGWFAVIVGLILALAGYQAFGVMAVAAGALIVVAGLIQVAAGQGVRAAIDAADYARQSFMLQAAHAMGLSEINLQGRLPSSPSHSGNSQHDDHVDDGVSGGFDMVEHRDGVPIYSDGPTYVVDGKQVSSLENARAYARSVARSRRQ